MERPQASALEASVSQRELNKLESVLAFFWLEFSEFLVAEEYLKQNDFRLQN